MMFYVHAAGRADRLLAPVRNAVHEVDRSLPCSTPRPLRA